MYNTNKHEIIILMQKRQAHSPDKINQDIRFSKSAVIQDFGPVKQARYLITQRKKIGIADNTAGLTPEEIDN